MKEKLKWFFNSFIWLGVLGLIVDIITKLVIKTNLVEGQRNDLIPGFLAITFTYNEAAAFGMGFDNPEVNKWMYIVIALVVSAVIIFFFVKKFDKFNKFLRACLMLIVAGAIGNVIDRFIYGKVVDFIDFYGIWNAIFNVADCCIVIGTIMLIVYLIIEEVKEYRRKKKEEPEPQGKVLSKEEQERLKRDSEPEEIEKE